MRGEDVTPATDVYALGVIAYEMLTGGRPFDGANQATLVTQTLTGRPISAATRRAGLAAGDRRGGHEGARQERQRAMAVGDRLRRGVAGRGWETRRRRRGSSGDAGLLSRYELGGMLGRGRLGSLIYRGTHRALGVPVAIRVLKRDEQPHWDAVRARFLLEARTLQVSHPSLLQVRDFGEDDRSVYLVTDLIEGPSLRQAMAEAGPMPWPRAQNLITQALDAVSALHAQRRIHLRRQPRHDPPSRLRRYGGQVR